MFETVISLLALGVACLAYYRATHRQLPTVYLVATNEDPFDPDWRIRIHNPTPCPIYLKRITIHEPRPDMVGSIAHESLSIRGTIERAYLEDASPGSSNRRVREIHFRVDPGASEDLRIDITAGEGTGEDPPAYNISFETEWWSHELPFPDAYFWVYPFSPTKYTPEIHKLAAKQLSHTIECPTECGQSHELPAPATLTQAIRGTSFQP